METGQVLWRAGEMSTSGAWAIWRPRVSDAVSAYTATISDTPRTVQMAEQGIGKRGRVALVNVQGVLTRTGSDYGTSTQSLTERIHSIIADGTFDALALRINSVGGNVAGIHEAADAIAKAAETMHVVACVEDYGCSAAYWLASQADEIYATESSVVGSIGTLMVLPDMSRMFEDHGVTLHVISTGPHKGAGVPGSVVTEEQLAELQRVINSHNELFLKAVSAGRGFNRTQMESLADGKVYLARQAQELGLIDGVATITSVLEMMSAPDQERDDMSTTVEVSVRDQEIQALCPGASADFRLAQLAASATNDQVLRAWSAELAARIQVQSQVIAERDAAMTALTEQLAAAEAGRAGNDVGGEDAGTSASDPVGDFYAAVRERSAKCKTRTDALMAVAREQPALHAAFLAATS